MADIGGNTIPFPQFNSGVGSNAGANPASIIDELTKSSHSPEEMQRLAQAAATPIPGGHNMATPLNLQPNQKGFTPAPLNERPAPVGKGNARGQGIGNAIIGVTNAITGVTIAEKNKKQLQVATDTQTLLTSQNSIDQAKQILESDPNNQAAKDAIDHNQKIMNGILSDKKTRDAISKGFKIDFTDPEANKTDDHAAVNQGQEMAKKSLSLAEQFGKGIPTTVQPNTVAQMKYQQAVMEQKANAETLRSLAPIISAQIRSGAQVDAAKVRADGENFRAAYTSGQKALLENQHFMHAQELLGIKYTQESKLVAQKAGAALHNAETLLNFKEQDPVALRAKSVTTLSELQRSSGEIQSRLTQLQDEIQKKDTDPKRAADMSQEIEALKGQKQSTDSMYTDTKRFFDGLILKGGSANAGPDGSNTDPDTDNEGADELNDINNYEQRAKVRSEFQN